MCGRSPTTTAAVAVFTATAMLCLNGDFANAARASKIGPGSMRAVCIREADDSPAGAAHAVGAAHATTLMAQTQCFQVMSRMFQAEGYPSRAHELCLCPLD